MSFMELFWCELLRERKTEERTVGYPNMKPRIGLTQYHDVGKYMLFVKTHRQWLSKQMTTIHIKYLAIHKVESRPNRQHRLDLNIYL